MSLQTISPGRLAIQLAIYFGVVFGVMIVLVESRPDLIRHLPIGGIDAPGGVDVAEMQDLATDDEKERQSEQGRRISTQDAADKIEVEQIRLFHRDKRADIEDEP